MAVIFKADLRNLKKRVKALTTGLPANMQKTGNEGIILVQENWNKAKGADGKKLDDLQKAYKARKRKSGRKGIPDLQFSGQLRQSMFARVRGNKALLTFRGREALQKARGNAKTRNNMMLPGRKLAKALTDFFFRLMT